MINSKMVINSILVYVLQKIVNKDTILTMSTIV